MIIKKFLWLQLKVFFKINKKYSAASASTYSNVMLNSPPPTLSASAHQTKVPAPRAISKLKRWVGRFNENSNWNDEEEPTLHSFTSDEKIKLSWTK